jgi:hypothetical protein
MRYDQSHMVSGGGFDKCHQKKKSGRGFVEGVQKYETDR